jgi:hypothetical protein
LPTRKRTHGPRINVFGTAKLTHACNGESQLAVTMAAHRLRQGVM